MHGPFRLGRTTPGPHALLPTPCVLELNTDYCVRIGIVFDEKEEPSPALELDPHLIFIELLENFVPARLLRKPKSRCRHRSRQDEECSCRHLKLNFST